MSDDPLEQVILAKMVDSAEPKCEGGKNACYNPAVYYGKHGDDCIIFWCQQHAILNKASLELAKEADQWIECQKCKRQQPPEDIEISVL